MVIIHGLHTNPLSSTYGQVTSVTILTPGENYPVDGSKTTVNGQFPEVYIDDIIIEDPGSDYQEGDFISDDIRPVVDSNPDSPNFGRIVAIEIVEQIPYDIFPDMTVISETGYGAEFIPIMRYNIQSTSDIVRPLIGITTVIDCPTTDHQ